MENNKLDNLFEATRKQDPIISMDEAMEMLNKKTDESQFMGGSGISRIRNLMIGTITAVIVVTGFYLSLRTNLRPVNPPQESVSLPTNLESVKPPEANEIPATPAATALNANEALGSEENKESVEVDKSREVMVATKPNVKMKDEHFGSVVKNAYLLENQTVNINNDKGKFRVHFSGNELAKLEMGDAVVQHEDWSNFEDIIAEARAVKNSMGINTANSANKKFVDYLFQSLKEKKLIENNLSVIRLSNENLLIDGIEADSAIHQELIHHYKSVMGENLGNRTLYFN